MEIKNQSFDAFIVNCKGIAPKGMISALEMAKRNSQGLPHDGEFEWRGSKCAIKANGSAGGYAYILDTGPLGETVLIKKSNDREQWNIRVEFRALNLKTRGIHGSWAHMEHFLSEWGCQILAYGIGRVDYAVDLEMAESWCLEPSALVMHSRMVARTHNDLSPLESEAFQVVGARRVTSVTIGQKGNRQIQIYDKRAEQTQTGKTEWFELWNTTKEDCPPIWRVEVRLFNEHLKSWNIRTFEDLQEGLGTAMKKALLDVRYCSEIDHNNAARSTVHPMWAMVYAAYDDAFNEMCDGRQRGKIISIKRDDAVGMIEKQIAGLAATLCFLRDVFGTAVPDEAVCIATEPIRARILQEPDKWNNCQENADARYRFIDEIREAA